MNLKKKTYNDKNNNDNDNIQDDNNQINYSYNLIDPIIRNSLEYYDRFQPKIQKILNEIEYLEQINNNNVTDEFIFYNKNDDVIFKSKYEILSFYLPDQNIWKWSWSIPTADPINTFISRKILEYAFTLHQRKDYLIKSTLINSNIKIFNQMQLDIYVAISAMISKKPFILKLYLVRSEKKKNKKYYYYRKIIDSPKKDKYISFYILILDWNQD